MQRSAVLPYEGTKPYIFVSYAHKDSDKVMAVLEQLDQRGYRIWYDDGIAPGSEWPENIAQHLNDCSLMMAFISPNSIASDNCRREITFALSKKKPFLAVILKESEMPLGMEMQLSAQQCVVRHGYRSEAAFINKLCSCPDMAPCLEKPPEESKPEAVEEKKPEPPVKAKTAKSAKTRKKWNKRQWTLLGSVAAVILLVVLSSTLLKVKITDSKKVGLNETILTVGNETVTKEMVQKINRLKKLSNLSFRSCAFESGALQALRLPEELKGLTISECTGVDNLSFLQELEELNTLVLDNCGLTDAILPELTLPKLRSVDLSDNEGFSNLAGISGCTEITELNIEKTAVQSLESLNCDNLGTLNFCNTSVTDIGPLAAATQLRVVRGSDTKVAEIEALAGLTTLTTVEFNNCRISLISEPFASLRLADLRLENNALTELSAFADCTVLKNVHLAGNQITDISILGKDTATLEALTLSYNPLSETDLSFLKNCSSLTELSMDGIPAETLDMLANMQELVKLSAVGCEIVDIGGLAGCSKLKWVRLANNQIGDISPLKNIAVSAKVTLDIGYNPVNDLSSLPDVSYAMLSIIGMPADPGTLPAVKGDAIALDYDDRIAGSQLAQNTFTRYYMVNCPADKQVAMEDRFGSYRLRFLYTAEDVISQLQEMGLDYRFARERMEK